MSAFRDALLHMRGRLARTSLTVAGIAIGIFALVVVGSLAERLGEIVARSTALNGSTVFAIVSRSMLVRGDLAAIRRAGTALQRLSGVQLVVPEVVLPYDPGGTDNRFGPPSLIFGLPDGERGVREALNVSSGRDLRPGDRRVAVVGADFAAVSGARAGDVISLYGNSYTVVGIFAKSFTLFDSAAVVPFADAQKLLDQDLPPSISTLPANGMTAFLVVPRPGTDPGVLVGRINAIDGLRARDPAELAETLRSTLRIFDSIVFGAALVALLIAGFSIVNTMTIAVTERTREIGIRKAIGATDADVLREFLAEAAAIGTLGGVTGIALGAAVVAYVDSRSAAGGSLELFALSPRVAAAAMAFAVGLSLLAGFIPALHAARLQPTDALRHA